MTLKFVKLELMISKKKNPEFFLIASKLALELYTYDTVLLGNYYEHCSSGEIMVIIMPRILKESVTDLRQ
jgi:hypothetical protein